MYLSVRETVEIIDWCLRLEEMVIDQEAWVGLEICEVQALTSGVASPLIGYGSQSGYVPGDEPFHSRLISGIIGMSKGGS